MMTHQQARTKLIDYMKEVLRVTVRPNDPVGISLEEIAEFCDLLRKGCQQDTVRLLLKLAKDEPNAIRRETLRDFADTIYSGGDIKLWGLNDCACDRAECVYCGPRIAKRVLATCDAQRGLGTR